MDLGEDEVSGALFTALYKLHVTIHACTMGMRFVVGHLTSLWIHIKIDVGTSSGH